MSEKSEPTLSRSDQKLWGYLAEYESPGALKKAAAEVRKAGFKKFDCYSPFPVHGIDPAMGIKMTILPILVFCAGVAGTGLAILLQWWANAYDWPWIVSGKPFFSLPANIPIGFEVTVLLAAFTAFFGMWGLNKLPQVWHPLFSKERFLKVTNDGFFIAIEAEDEKFDADGTKELLEGAGASAVEPCHVSTDPKRRRLPRPILAFIICSASIALVPFAFIAKAKSEKSRDPHWHVIPNMDFQEHRRAQSTSEFFPDGRVSQPWAAGTIAKGELKTDDAFFRGVEGGQWLSAFPVRPGRFEVNAQTMKRGRERYNIYCTPCHGYNGYGEGMIHKRAEEVSTGAWTQPRNLHQAEIVKQPHGQLYNTISHGKANMKGYAAQISEADRWAIVLYLRALQRSQASYAGDLPPELRKSIR